MRVGNVTKAIANAELLNQKIFHEPDRKIDKREHAPLGTTFKKKGWLKKGEKEREKERETFSLTKDIDPSTPNSLFGGVSNTNNGETQSPLFDGRPLSAGSSSFNKKKGGPPLSPLLLSTKKPWTLKKYTAKQFRRDFCDSPDPTCEEYKRFLYEKEKVINSKVAGEFYLSTQLIPSPDGSQSGANIPLPLRPALGTPPPYPTQSPAAQVQKDPYLQTSVSMLEQEASTEILQRIVEDGNEEDVEYTPEERGYLNRSTEFADQKRQEFVKNQMSTAGPLRKPALKGSLQFIAHRFSQSDEHVTNLLEKETADQVIKRIEGVQRLLGAVLQQRCSEEEMVDRDMKRLIREAEGEMDVEDISARNEEARRRRPRVTDVNESVIRFKGTTHVNEYIISWEQKHRLVLQALQCALTEITETRAFLRVIQPHVGMIDSALRRAKGLHFVAKDPQETGMKKKITHDIAVMTEKLGATDEELATMEQWSEKVGEYESTLYDIEEQNEEQYRAIMENVRVTKDIFTALVMGRVTKDLTSMFGNSLRVTNMNILLLCPEDMIKENEIFHLHFMQNGQMAMAHESHFKGKKKKGFDWNSLEKSRPEEEEEPVFEEYFDFGEEEEEQETEEEEEEVVEEHVREDWEDEEVVFKGVTAKKTFAGGFAHLLVQKIEFTKFDGIAGPLFRKFDKIVLINGTAIQEFDPYIPATDVMLLAPVAFILIRKGVPQEVYGQYSATAGSFVETEKPVLHVKAEGVPAVTVVPTKNSSTNCTGDEIDAESTSAGLKKDDEDDDLSALEMFQMLDEWDDDEDVSSFVPRCVRISNSKGKIPAAWGKFANVAKKKMDALEIAPQKQTAMTLCKVIHEIFVAKIEADKLDDDSNRPRSKLAEFCCDFFLQKYGIRKLAKERVIDLIFSVKQHKTSSAWVTLFAKFVGVFDSMPTEFVSAFLHFYKCVHHSGRITELKGDGIGIIEVTGAEHLLAGIFVAISAEGFKQMMDNINKMACKNKFGIKTIRVDDFLAVALQQHISEYDNHVVIMKDAFAKADTGNANGVLDYDEFCSMLRMVHPKISLNGISSIFLKACSLERRRTVNFNEEDEDQGITFETFYDTTKGFGLILRFFYAGFEDSRSAAGKTSQRNMMSPGASRRGSSKLGSSIRSSERQLNPAPIKARLDPESADEAKKAQESPQSDAPGGAEVETGTETVTEPSE